MSRTGATLPLYGVQIGMPLVLVAITSLASRFPDSMMNIPTGPAGCIQIAGSPRWSG
jgi:hypothetical protein